MGKNKNKGLTKPAAVAQAAVATETKTATEKDVKMQEAADELKSTFVINEEAVEEAKKRIMELEGKQKAEDAMHIIGISEYTVYRVLFKTRFLRKQSEIFKSVLLKVSALRDYAIQATPDEDYTGKDDYKNTYEEAKKKYPKGMDRKDYTTEVNNVFIEARKQINEGRTKHDSDVQLAKNRLDVLGIWSWTFDLDFSRLEL